MPPSCLLPHAERLLFLFSFPISPSLYISKLDFIILEEVLYCVISSLKIYFWLLKNKLNPWCSFSLLSFEDESKVPTTWTRTSKNDRRIFSINSTANQTCVLVIFKNNDQLFYVLPYRLSRVQIKQEVSVRTVMNDIWKQRMLD